MVEKEIRFDFSLHINSRIELIENVSSFKFWSYKTETKQLHHKSSDRCMAISSDNQKLLMEDCNSHREAQKWLFENYDASKLNK